MGKQSKVTAIIPARYGSTRLPAKLLLDLQGKPIIQHVYERTSKAQLIDEVLIATDDERIYNHVLSFGGKAVNTKAEHPSGTDRCYEALLNSKQSFDYVINIQGDEPFIDPTQIDLLCGVCDKQTELATLMIPVDSHEVLFDVGEVKITLNSNMEALYFSRMVIPYIKGKPQEEWHKYHTYYRHVGMYAYRSDVLENITKLQPSALENAESLEQLRWLENGYKVKCVITHFDSHCVDTPEDIEKVIRLMKIQ